MCLKEKTDNFRFVEQLNKSKVRGEIMKKCEWCNLSEEDKKYLLSDNKYWTVYLADEQDYIGRCIIVLKRHCGTLPELKDDEWSELLLLIKKYEKCVKTVFDAEYCNWSCLMNSFYKSPEPCPHIHIHVRPRYKNPVVINGNTYLDNNFGHHYSIGRTEQIFSKEDIQIIYGLLKKWLNS